METTSILNNNFSNLLSWFFSTKSNYIDLAVYDGQESILLSWSLDDSVTVSQTKIYVKEFGEKEFNLLNTIPDGNLKYLALKCHGFQVKLFLFFQMIIIYFLLGNLMV